MKLKTGPANWETNDLKADTSWVYEITDKQKQQLTDTIKSCLLYTSPSPRD